MDKRQLTDIEKELIKRVNRNAGYYSWRTKELVKKLEKIQKGG